MLQSDAASRIPSHSRAAWSIASCRPQPANRWTGRRSACRCAMKPRSCASLSRSG
jgi:hypothetical protein